MEEQLTKDQSLGERTNIPVCQLVELVELCLRITYFQFQEDFFEQTDGAAMGSPLSPIIVNLFSAAAAAAACVKLFARCCFAWTDHLQ